MGVSNSTIIQADSNPLMAGLIRLISGTQMTLGVSGNQITFNSTAPSALSGLSDIQTPLLYTAGFVLQGNGSGKYTGALLSHLVLTNIGTNTHAQIDTHIANTSNPHSVTAAQAAAVALTGNETVFGTKTFDVIPASNGTPVLDDDLTTKSYVDVLVSTGARFVTSATAATTAALAANTYNNGTAGVGATLTANANGAFAAQDGVTLVVNDKLLVKNEAAPENNGLYVVTQVGNGGAPYILTRSTLYDVSAEIVVGTFFTVVAGTTLIGTQWSMTNNNTITVGTDAITFAQLSAPKIYTGSLGVQLVGMDFRANLAASQGLALSGNQVVVDYDNSSLGIVSTKLAIKSAGVVNAMLASGIDATKITTGTVGASVNWGGVTIPVNKGGTGQTTYTNGQILIGNTTGNTLTKATITGTANRVTVTNGTGTITLSGPQDLATSSSPTFASLLMANGTAALPSYTFTGDTDTGFYRSSSNTIGIASNGVQYGAISNTLFNLLITKQYPTSLWAKGSYINMGGQAVADTGRTGMYEKNELGHAARRGNVTINITGAGTYTNTVQNVNKLFAFDPGNFFTISGVDNTTTQVQIVIDLLTPQPNYSNANWLPMVQTRLQMWTAATGNSGTYFRNIVFEISLDGITYSKPTGGQWETANAATVSPVPGYWFGGLANANNPITVNQYQFVRITLTDIQIDPGYVNNGDVWICQLGLFHTGAPWSRNYIQADGDTMWGNLLINNRTTPGAVDLLTLQNGGATSADRGILPWKNSAGSYMARIGAMGDASSFWMNFAGAFRLGVGSATYANNHNLVILPGGQAGLKITTPTAWWHLPAGTATAGTAPQKFINGVLLTVPEAGADEYASDKRYFTINTGTNRKEYTFNDTALTNGRVPIVTTNGRLTDLATFTYSVNRLSPTYITLAAGTATANTGPLKFTQGVKTTTKETGLMELDNHFWLTNAQIRFPLGGTLFDHYTNVGNSGTTETDLYSDTLVASTLISNGDKIFAKYSGFTIANATATRTFKVYFGGNLIYIGTALVTPTSVTWDIDVLIIRVSATVIRAVVKYQSTTSSATQVTNNMDVVEITGLTLSSTNILKVTGQAGGVGAASNDIVARLGTVSLQPGA